MKKFLIPVIAIVAMVGCKKTTLSSGSEQYGYLKLDLSTDTEMTVVTKAEPTAEELAAYNVTLVNSASGVTETKEYAEISEDGWKLAPGMYNVYVENLTDDEAAPENDKGTVMVAGTCDVTVATGVTSEVEVACTPVNSRVTVNYDDSFAQVFIDPQLTLGTESRIFDMTWGHDVNNSVYYPAGSQLSWTLNAKLSGDSTQKTYHSSTSITTQAGKWTQVTFSTSSADGSIKITITVSVEFNETVTETVVIDPFEGN